MAFKIWQSLNKYKLTLVACLAALLYNNWLLAPFISHSLFIHNGSVSELSVASQPYHWVFQLLDMASGALFTVTGYLLWPTLKFHRVGRAVAILIGGLGLVNIVDALLRLPCSETLDAKCIIPVNISLSNFQVPAHAYSSVAIGVLYLLLPVIVLIYSYKSQFTLLLSLSFLIILDTLYSMASVTAEYVRQGTFTTKTSGGSQELEMALFSLWLALTIMLLAIEHRRTEKLNRQ